MHALKQIASQDTFAVRQPVLRPGKGIETCIFEGDDLPTTVHFGVFDNEALVGVISVFKMASPYFNEKMQFQIRGMAVLDAEQKKGLGEKLIRKAEQHIMQNKGTCIWLNAREIAVGFYRKCGYIATGTPFNIGDIGLHYVMYKILEVN